MLQFLECRQQICYRPAPAVQPQTSTTSISRRRAASRSFSRASRFAAPEFTIEDRPGAIVQPRRASATPASTGSASPASAGSIRRNAGIQIGAEHFRPPPRAWPKTCPDFAFWEARFMGIFRASPALAGVDPFRPGRIHHNPGGASVWRIVPGQNPLRRIRRQFPGMPLQLR